MPKPPLILAARARGALLGLAAGNALGVPAEFLGTAEAIAARFPGGLRDVVRQDTVGSPWDDDLALAVILGEEIARPPIDLKRLAGRWIDWARTDGRGIGGWTQRALDHIARFDAPPETGDGQAGNGPVSRCLPVALATFTSPRTLMSATYHTARLTHPDERACWAAVAVNVAAARFLDGKRDFVPDVIEALLGNRAPEEVVTAVRRVPIRKREDLPVVGAEAGYAVHCMEIALWFGHHEPNLERGLRWLVNAGGDTDTNAAVAGGLMGARDGEDAIPDRWVSCVPEAVRIGDLAERLVRMAHPGAA